MFKIVAALFAISLTASQGLADEPFQPESIVRCLKNPKAASLTILNGINPFYLRGDFDGDGRPDYAVRVRSGTGAAGVLVCAGNRSLFLLGSVIRGGTQFSDMEGDAFLAPQWEVFTVADVAELRRFRSNVPRPVPSVKGEAIAMIWEDGISLIYWDGAKFRWAGSKE